MSISNTLNLKKQDKVVKINMDEPERQGCVVDQRVYCSWKLREKGITREREWVIPPNATVSSNKIQT